MQVMVVNVTKPSITTAPLPPAPPHTVDIDTAHISMRNIWVTAHVMGVWLGRMELQHELNVIANILRYTFTNDSDAVMFKLYSSDAMAKAAHKLYK